MDNKYTGDVIWLDLETTGLDPEKDHVLEIAMAIAPWQDKTNPHTFFQAVIHHSYEQYRCLLMKMDPYVKKMHDDNGLLKAIRDPIQHVAEIITPHPAHPEKSVLHSVGNVMTADEARAIMAKILNIRAKGYFSQNKDERPWIAGANPSFDVSFLKDNPMFVGQGQIIRGCSYHTLDVRAIRPFAEDCGVLLHDETFEPAHRAMLDVEIEIAEYQYLVAQIKKGSLCSQR